MQWVELHGPELIGLSVESATERVNADGFKVMVSRFPRPSDFPSPYGDRVYLYVDENAVAEVDAQ